MSSMKIELSTIGRTHVQWDDTGLHNTVRIAIAPDDLATLAAANGYVKADDYEMLRTKVQSLEDEIVEWKCASGLETSAGDPADITPATMQQHWERFESEHTTCITLADDEIVMPRIMARVLIEDRCEACEDEGLSDCGDCDLKPIRDRLKGVKK